MLKTRVTSLDEVPAALREHYTAHPNGGFQLDSDGAQELRTALTHERQHRKTAENRATELEEQLRIARGQKEEEPETPRLKFIRENVHRLKPFEQGTPEWQAEHDKILAEMEPFLQIELDEIDRKWKDRIEKSNGQNLRIVREHEATLIATEIARQGSAGVLQPLLLHHIDVVRQDDDKFVPTYRDKSGSPVSREGLVALFREDAALAPVIRGASRQEKEAHARRVAETLGQKH